MTEVLNLTCQSAQQAGQYQLWLGKLSIIQPLTAIRGTAHKLKREECG